MAQKQSSKTKTKEKGPHLSLDEVQGFADLGLWTFDPLKKVWNVSESFLRLLRAKPGTEIVNLFDLAHPDDLQVFKTSVEYSLQRKRPLRMEVRLLKSNQDVRTFRFMGGPREDNGTS